jgi:hypothetical protein
MKIVRPASEDLRRFLLAFDPAIAELALALRAEVVKIAPTATEMVYDAYSAVAMGFTHSGRLKEAFCHIAVYGRHVNLGFNRGTELDDPARLLKGTGNLIRHIKITSTSDFKNPHVRKLMRAAISHSKYLFPEATATTKRPVLIVKEYARKRRPWRQ